MGPRQQDAEKSCNPHESMVRDGQLFRCVKKAQARIGFSLESEKSAVVTVGETFKVLQSGEDATGITRLRLQCGWVSEISSKGDTCFVLAEESDQEPSE